MQAVIAILASAGVTGAVWTDPPAASTAPPLRNYVAEWAAEVEAIPESDRAWPLYKEADASLRPLQEYLPEGVAYQDVWPGHEHWPALVRWLDDHRPALALAKQGASRKLVGAPVTTEAEGDSSFPKQLAAQDPPMMVGVILPHLGTTRQLVRLAGVEMLAAVEAGDAVAGWKRSRRQWECRCRCSRRSRSSVRWLALRL